MYTRKMKLVYDLLLVMTSRMPRSNGLPVKSMTVGLISMTSHMSSVGPSDLISMPRGKGAVLWRHLMDSG